MAEEPKKTTARKTTTKRVAAKSTAAKTETPKTKSPKDSDQYGFICVLTIYILYLLGAVFIVPIALVLVGFLVALFAKKRFAGTIYTSHLDNQIKIFLYALLFLIVLTPVTVILLVYPLFIWPALLVWLILYIWFVYQSVIGILAVLDDKPRDFAWY